MKILIFLAGVIIGVVLRNVIAKIIEIRKKLKYADSKMQEEQKHANFREKYDYGDCFNEDEPEDIDEE